MNPEAAAAGRFAHVTSTTNWWFSLAMPCHHSMLCLLDLARACSAQVLATPPYPDSEQPCGVLSSFMIFMCRVALVGVLWMRLHCVSLHVAVVKCCDMLQRILMISFQPALLQSYHAMWPRAITQLAPWCCERAM